MNQSDLSNRQLATYRLDRLIGQGGMAQVSALRETSVILAALIGTRLLGEPFGGRRVLAAAVVAVGVALLQP